MSNEVEEDTYTTFKGMGVVAMVKGVPLLPGLAIASVGVLTGFIGCIAFGPIGLVGPALCALAIFGLKVICENDNKALEVAKWKIKGALLRFKQVTTVLTVSASAIGSKHAHILRHLKKIHRSK